MTMLKFSGKSMFIVHGRNEFDRIVLMMILFSLKIPYFSFKEELGVFFIPKNKRYQRTGNPLYLFQTGVSVVVAPVFSEKKNRFIKLLLTIFLFS